MKSELGPFLMNELNDLKLSKKTGNGLKVFVFRVFMVVYMVGQLNFAGYIENSINNSFFVAIYIPSIPNY